MRNLHSIFDAGNSVWVITTDLHTDDDSACAMLSDYTDDFDIVSSAIVHVYENDYEWTYSCAGIRQVVQHRQVYATQKDAVIAINQEMNQRRTLLKEFADRLNQMQFKLDDLIGNNE
jgi:hypothetical protein